MMDTIKVLIWIETYICGSRVEDLYEFDKEEWESMSDDERDAVCRDIAFQNGAWGWKEVAHLPAEPEKEDAIGN